MVEAPTWQDNVVEAPTWRNSAQITIMDHNPDLERGQGFSWDRVVQCDANDPMNVDTIVYEEEVGMLVLNGEDIELVDKEVDEQSD